MPPYNSRNDDLAGDKQADVTFSVERSRALVQEVATAFAHVGTHVVEYVSRDRLKNAPAMPMNTGELAICPDTIATTSNGSKFWIEVKDKAQRAKYPDTGADLHQVLGWVDVSRHTGWPVLLVFRDPPMISCLPGNATLNQVAAFSQRWERFGGGLYGHWLSICLRQHSRLAYPIVSLERSRNDARHIFYFHVVTLRSISGHEIEIAGSVDSETVPSIPAPIGAYSKSKWLTEDKLRALIHR